MPETSPLTIEKSKEITEDERKEKPRLLQAKTPEDQEVVFDLEEARQEWQDWYQDHGLKVEIPELSLKEEEIQEIQHLIEEGYVDKMAIIADGITYLELERAMTQGYEETWQSENFRADGGFQTLDQEETSLGFRLIFFKKAKELYQDPLLKQTLDRSPDQMEKFFQDLEKQGFHLEGLSLKDYLIIQRKCVEETERQKDIQDRARHLETDRVTWCLKSKFSSGRVAKAIWMSELRQLLVGADSSSHSSPHMGTRLARSFQIG